MLQETLPYIYIFKHVFELLSIMLATLAHRVLEPLNFDRSLYSRVD